MIFIITIIIFISIRIDIIKSIIVLPLRRVQPYINLTNSYELINYCQPNDLYTILKIGEPPQNLELSIKEENIHFSLNKQYCNLNEFYNKSISKTFKNITEYGDNIFNYDYSLVEETFYMHTDLDLKNLKKFENIRFIYEKENEYKKREKEIYNNCGVITLGIFKYNFEINDYNFIYELKRLNFINDYAWTIKFIENENNKNKIEGYLIIGDYPHNYEKQNFKETNLRTTLNNMEKNNWNLEFKNITINDTQLTHYNFGIISFSTNYIIGTEEYKSKISYMFFNEYVKKNICYDDYSNSRNFIYYCKSNEFSKEDIDKFPTLNFYHFQFNYTFSFNGSDLFFESNGYYYFLIIFDRYNYQNWWFGKLFLKKYQLIFDPDSKRIIYYISNNKKENKEKDVKIQNKKIIIISLIIIGILSFIIGLVIGSFIYGNKNKKKAKEMKDKYEYFYENKESFQDSENIVNNKVQDSIN